MEWSVHEANLVLLDDFEEGWFSIKKVLKVLFLVVILESDFNSTVIFEKFYLVASALWTLLYLLEQMLTV
jgi:hypothetical protein